MSSGAKAQLLNDTCRTTTNDTKHPPSGGARGGQGGAFAPPNFQSAPPNFRSAPPNFWKFRK
ncbi:MAG: hypothetical protein GY820_14515 [Gammaproteobacteria bacterium]|nr:hypothetical protein [Gammaproteobacteria bacterium]